MTRLRERNFVAQRAGFQNKLIPRHRFPSVIRIRSSTLIANTLVSEPQLLNLSRAPMYYRPQPRSAADLTLSCQVWLDL